MKINAKKTAIKGLSVTSAAVLIAAFAVSGSGFTGGNGTAFAVRSDLNDVTGKYDSQSLRSQYYNSEIVGDNVFAADASNWVIVDMEGDSLMDAYSDGASAESFSEYVGTREAKNLASELEKQHKVFLSRLSAKGIEYECKYSYTALTNGVAIKIKNKDFSAVRSMSGVSGVYYSQSYESPAAVSNNANVYTTGIYKTEGIDYKGEGMTVAVLDTGLDYSHTAFQTPPSSASQSEDTYMKASDVENVLSRTEASKRLSSLTLDQVHLSEKVPFAFDYADDDADVYPSYSSHGTHVAGIVAGKDDNKIVNTETNETFKGVAPEAQLVICKVFTDDPDSKMLGGADSMDILAALSDCVTPGVDVINMSLGTSAGFSSEDGNEFLMQVYNKVETSGTSLIVAASNDYSSGYGGGNGTNLATNPDSGTVGSPSTFSGALSVASIQGKLSRYMTVNGQEDDVAFITEATDGNGNEYNFMEQLYERTGTPKDQKLTLNYVSVGGVGKIGEYTRTIKNALSDGRTLAVVKRGDITFAEKVQNAMESGALGVIIYNNLSGNIRMSLGEVVDPIPACSVGMEAGLMIAGDRGMDRGTLTFSYGYQAGPFMSDFSSWGPTPDLKLKPEITAHGGEITSAVPGGGYDEMSGTSMAAPNMAGAFALLRQHVKAETSLKGVALNARVNQLLMSTATMALNEVGNPYSPRKQGAGLADIKSAIETEGYITVEGKDGSLDKTKIELGDDRDKRGVYEMKFTVRNMTDKETSYSPKAYVMTETIASDERTVSERAYMLNDFSEIAFKVNGTVLPAGQAVTVPANGTAEVEVTVTLLQEARDYIDRWFTNGMYVEGYIRLDADGSSAKVNLGIPFLGFYGDWTDGPMFDYSLYEIAESERLAVEDKDILKASAAATRPLGLYDDGQYIIPLGSYIYDMKPSDTEIYASDERAAISTYDVSGRRTVYELYMLYAGLLRGAKTMQVDIVDTVTGELVYSKLEKEVRKSYAAGGANRGSNIMLGINPVEWGLNNNTQYTFTATGQLDYEGGENPANNTFSFNFTVDTEAPAVTDYRIRFEPYTENQETKYRIYMDVDVFDNHYAMDLMPCYVKNNTTLTLLTQYPVPVYSQKGSQTTVSFEITDYYEDYVQTGNFYISVEDYAMNQAVYEVNYAAAKDYPDTVTLATDDKLAFVETVTQRPGGPLSKPVTYNVYSLTLARNELYKLKVNALPDANSAAALMVSPSSNCVMTNGHEIYGLSAGNCDVYVYEYGATDSSGGTVAQGLKARIIVNVSRTLLPEAAIDKITLRPVINGSDYLVNLDVSDASVELHANETVQFVPSIEPWYLDMPELEWTSSNSAVFTVDENGVVTTHGKGRASLGVQVKGQFGLKKVVTIIVDDEYDVSDYRLYHFYGAGEVVVPEDKNIMYLSEEAFRGNTKITKLTLPSTLTEIPKGAFSGCVNLKEIVIPDKCTFIGESAFSAFTSRRGTFKACEALEKITLLPAEDKVTGQETTGTLTVGKSAFKDCIKLKTIENQHRLTTVYSNAFENCTSLSSLDLSGLRVGGSEVFKNCTNLKTVTTSDYTYLGNDMFKGCTSLDSFEVKATRIPAGLFDGCSALKQVTFPNGHVLYDVGARAFANTAITGITLPNGTYPIGDNAFADCKKLAQVTLSPETNILKDSLTPFANCAALKSFALAGASSFYAVQDGVLYNADKTTVECVPAGKAESEISLPSTVTKIGAGAFAGSAVTSVDLSKITEIGAYAFSGCQITSVNLSSLTAIPEGAFAYCAALKQVLNADRIVEVGAYAFDRANLENLVISLPAATSVGDYAFNYTKLKGISADILSSVGERAFYGTNLTETVNLPALTEIGAYAFANCYSVKAFHLGAVTKMGAFAFRVSGASQLSAVTFANGASVVGDYAFAAYDSRGNLTARPALTNVVVPATVTEIGEYAFINLTNLKSDGIDLSGVTAVGNLAFFGCGSLTNLDLGNVLTIGAQAFDGTKKIASVELTSAKEIGAGAFRASGLTEATYPVAEKIGFNAFSGTKLTEITIPATMNELTYEDEWYVMNDAGRLELKTGRKAPRLGAGAFADIPTLLAINVAAGNEAFVSYDGVLYSFGKEGLTLVQYPAGKTAEGGKYSVRENTVRIADWAFEGVKNVTAVFIPFTVQAIGDGAFYNSSVTDYTFESVEAPVLESYYTEDVSSDAFSQGLYYCNFKDYVYKVLHNTGNNFRLTVHYPENGIGYDTPIWNGFFSTVEKTAYAAERVTRKTIVLISDLPAASSIESGLTGTLEEKQEQIREFSKTQVQPVRALYKQISSAAQRALVTDYAKLLEVEKTVRDIKETLGIPAVMTALVLESGPDKYRYLVGESFDKTGMVVNAVYDDTSETEVTDYTVDKTVLALADDRVTVSYNGKSCIVYVSVSAEEEKPGPGDDDNKDDESGCGGCGSSLAYGAGGAVMIAGAAIAIVCVLKKRERK